MKKVSVIIPVYNVSEYLEKCLESIIQQEFADYEIICVDDASTDHSWEILDIYEKKYDAIKVIRHAQNRGLSAARNTGMDYATGKYIWFVDPDDTISPNSLTELYDISEENKTDMVCFELSFDKKDTELTTTNNIYDANKVYSGKELFCICAYDNTWSASACIKFLKRSFLIKNQIRFYEKLLHEDALFSFFCIIQAERIINANKVYYICNKRPTSITAQKTHKSAESNFVIMMQLIVYWYTHRFTERENDAMKAYVLSRYNGYLYYDRFGTRAESLDVGSPADKALYDILYQKPDKRISLDKGKLEDIGSAKNVIVFGADHYAGDVIDILKENGIKIHVVAVSKMAYNPTVFCGIKVDTIEHISGYVKDDTVIVLGVSLKNSMAVRHQLETMGYTNIIVPEYKE